MFKRAGLLTLVMILVWVSGTVLAQSDTGEKAADAVLQDTAIQMEAEPQDDGTYLLKARLLGADGRPLGNKTVTFQVEANFFIERPISIGESVTDTTGTATVPYDPSWTGEHELEASFRETDELAGATGTLVTEMERTVPAYENAPPPMQDYRIATGRVVFAVAAAVWLLMIGLVVWVVWRLPRARPAG